ncbi:hypothetical protein PUR_03960 [Paenibacillus sp. URB8-2]|nr:hypothetical protein PUR_03960 [Paenibacillus sp. URB8-2]
MSADIPSGLDADTGEKHEPCIQASLTVCLAFLKRGLLQYPGREPPAASSSARSAFRQDSPRKKACPSIG